MTSRRHFFATASDLLPGLRRFDEARSVQYVLAGLHGSNAPVVLDRGLDIPDLGSVAAGDANHVPRFLVLDRATKLVVREVPQRRGASRFAIDQLENPDSVVFQAGGCHSDSVLISGEIATTGVTPTANELYRLMAQAVTADFQRVQSFWVGPQALAMLQAGARLTKSVKSPSTYDLRQP